MQVFITSVTAAMIVTINPYQSHFQSWLLNWPKESLERLRVINQSTVSAEHIVIALAFGFFDSRICRVNRMITGLLLARLRAERSGQDDKVARINRFMDCVHVAIDAATGTTTARHGNGVPCSRPSKLAH